MNKHYCTYQRGPNALGFMTNGRVLREERPEQKSGGREGGNDRHAL